MRRPTSDLTEVPPCSSKPPRGESCATPRAIQATKAYKNQEWINSRSARHVRILCELLETGSRLTRNNVSSTILFFGSARGLSYKDWEKQVELAESDVEHFREQTEKKNKKKNGEARREAAQIANNDNHCDDDDDDDDEDSEIPLSYTFEQKRIEAESRLARLQKLKWMCEFYDKTYDLAKRLTQWAMDDSVRTRIDELAAQLGDTVQEEGLRPAEHTTQDGSFQSSSMPHNLVICTGGGPGMMEAANKGASSVEGGRSMGMGISLPFEPGLNPWVTPSLAFEFHYFFTRKFWMVYYTLGVVCTPGGLGTLDELMEVLTLKQTGKLKRNIPIVLLGKNYWKSIMQLDKMAEYGTISISDAQQLFYTDSADEAFEYITKAIMDTSCVDPRKMKKKKG